MEDVRPGTFVKLRNSVLWTEGLNVKDLFEYHVQWQLSQWKKYLRKVRIFYDSGDRSVDKPPYVWCDDHSAHIQRPLADRNIFQDDKAEFEDQDVRGNQPKRLVDADLDSINCHPGVEVSEVPVHARRSLSNLVAMLRYNLFTYRDLWIWLDNPFETLPIVPDAEQLVLSYR